MSDKKERRGRKADIVFKILDVVSDAGIVASEMIGSMLEPRSKMTAAYAAGAYDRTHTILERAAAKRAERRRQYQRYSMMVRYLKQNGMMQERRRGEVAKIYLTREGRRYLGQLRKERQNNLPGYGYERSPGKKVVIIAYDIPERYRKNRDWLRAVLKRLGFEAMQRSVWIGKIALPPRLLEDIALRHMTDYVEIVEVGSTGTFKHLA